MHIIVVGCGRVGAQLATMLSRDGHDVVVIDREEDAFRRLGEAFNGVTLRGVGFDEATLREAGIEKADALAAVTDLDNTNMMTAEVAVELYGVPVVVTRLYNPEREETYRRLGMNYICGTTLVAERVLDKLLGEKIGHVSVTADVDVVEFYVGEDMDGKHLSEIEIKDELRVSAVVRGGRGRIPSSDTVIRAGDRLIGAVAGRGGEKVERMSSTGLAAMRGASAEADAAAAAAAAAADKASVAEPDDSATEPDDAPDQAPRQREADDGDNWADGLDEEEGS